MRLDFPGLLQERMPSGKARWRVRVEGNKHRRVTLNVTPEHPNFREHYHAARAGIQLPPETAPEDATIRGSIGWLVVRYLAHMDKAVSSGLMNPATRYQRSRFLNQLREERGEYSLSIPTHEVVRMRDARAATPGAADNFVKSVRALYAWATETGICSVNPATGVKKINRRSRGAIPWTPDDLRAFREHHPKGTMAHLALSLFMFTACRLGDAVNLGRAHESTRNGVTWLSWQPEKEGSAPVSIPMLPPLYAATRAVTIVGNGPYLMTAHGRPFSSKNSLGNKFRVWCRDAGLNDRSPHGIRKAAGDLLALEGASQYHIMAIHGHTNAKTSEIYTKGVDRASLAREAMSLLAKMEW